MDILDELEIRRRVYRKVGMPRSLEAHMAASVLISRAHALRARRINALVRQWNLNSSTLEALVNLSTYPEGKCSLSKLSSVMILHQTTITSTIDRLEKLGYASRAPHPTDRRTTLVVLEDRGREVLAEANEQIADIQFGLGALSKADAQRIIEALSPVVRDEVP